MDASPPFRPEDLVGRTLCDRYRIVRPIGRGGMGIVYEAEQLDLRRRVALKLLDDDRPQSLARFRQEARALAALSCPHVVTIFDVHTDGAYPVFTMELLHGESLADRLLRGGAMPPTDAVTVARQMLVALEAAHGCGVVHRDVKPSNVFLTNEAGGLFVKLLGFGVAKVVDPGTRTATGTFVGTPHYFAPEQIEGRTEPRTDVHAVGLCLYEMLVGKRAWHATHAPEAARMALEHAPSLAGVEGVPVALANVVARSLSKDPSARWPDAATMRRALEALDAPTPRTATTSRRGRAYVFLTAVLGTVLLVALTALAVVLRRHDAPAADAPRTTDPLAAPSALIEVDATALTAEPTTLGEPTTLSAEPALPSASQAPPPARKLRTCVCDYEVNPRRFLRLCSRLLPPSCSCESPAGSTICPRPWKDGSCGTSFRGPDLKDGAECHGYVSEPSSSLVAGTLVRCTLCYGNADVPGEEGRPCWGYSPDGELLKGEFSACR